MPKFHNESEFEAHIRELLDPSIAAPQFVILDYKTVADIIICRNEPRPGIFFIEVKYFQLSKGRLGFGNNKGQGIQPEMLVKRPDYLETNVRWLLGSDSHDEDGYWLITSEVLRGYVSGGFIGKKQNNIQEALFREVPALDRDGVVAGITEWLRNT